MRNQLKKVICGSIVLLTVCFIGCADKKIGDACETYRSSECGGPGGTCLGASSGNYCTTSCTAASECPKGWKCAGITQTTINGSGEKKGEKVINMCVKS